MPTLHRPKRWRGDSRLGAEGSRGGEDGGVALSEGAVKNMGMGGVGDELVIFRTMQ